MYNEQSILGNAERHTWDETWEGAGELWYSGTIAARVRYRLIVHVTQLTVGEMVADEGLQIDDRDSRLWAQDESAPLSADRWYELRLGEVRRKRGAPGAVEVLLEPTGEAATYRIRLYRQPEPTDVGAYLFPE